MKEVFNCPVNEGTQLIVDIDDDMALISILTPWRGMQREEHIVCLSDSELQRFKEAVAKL